VRRVVCMSSLDGAGGEEVGRLVADRLGVPLLNEEIVARAARESGSATRQARVGISSMIETTFVG